MIGYDYGAPPKKSQAWGDSGALEIPSVSQLKPKGIKGKTSQAKKFGYQLAWLLSQDDVTAESPTFGSSGVEIAIVEEVVRNSAHVLYKVSARAVKNYKLSALDETEWDKWTDLDSARAIHRIAQNKERLKLWKPNGVPLIRDYTSVRPFDKRDYDDPEVEKVLSLVPDPLPDNLAAIFNSKARLFPVARAIVMESSVVDRESFDRVVGFYEHGYPSYYRRSFIDISNETAKSMFGVDFGKELSSAQRKYAQKIVRKAFRQLYHLMKGKMYPAKGKTNPS